MDEKLEPLKVSYLLKLAQESAEEVRKLKARIAEFDESIMAESRDPNGTIWEVANQFLARAEKAESEAAKLREKLSEADKREEFHLEQCAKLEREAAKLREALVRAIAFMRSRTTGDGWDTSEIDHCASALAPNPTEGA